MYYIKYGKRPVVIQYLYIHPIGLIFLRCVATYTQYTTVRIEDILPRLKPTACSSRRFRTCGLCKIYMLIVYAQSLNKEDKDKTKYLLKIVSFSYNCINCSIKWLGQDSKAQPHRKGPGEGSESAMTSSRPSVVCRYLCWSLHDVLSIISN